MKEMCIILNTEELDTYLDKLTEYEVKTSNLENNLVSLSIIFSEEQEQALYKSCCEAKALN